MSEANSHSSTLNRRAILAGVITLPALVAGSSDVPRIDPKAPKCIAWPLWAGHDRAGQVMTPAELAQRYTDPKKLRYALRRLARWQVETGRAVS